MRTLDEFRVSGELLVEEVHRAPDASFHEKERGHGLVLPSLYVTRFITPEDRTRGTRIPLSDFVAGTMQYALETGQAHEAEASDPDALHVLTIATSAAYFRHRARTKMANSVYLVGLSRLWQPDVPLASDSVNRIALSAVVAEMHAGQVEAGLIDAYESRARQKVTSSFR